MAFELIIDCDHCGSSLRTGCSTKGAMREVAKQVGWTVENTDVWCRECMWKCKEEAIRLLNDLPE